VETSRANQLVEMARTYLDGHYGSTEYFDLYQPTQRIGQAFFNSLSIRDQEAVRGRPKLDPFYDDSVIPDTIAHLLHMEQLWEEDDARAQTQHD
jgi:hypothetical protein